MNEDFLNRKLELRRAENAYRQLSLSAGTIDFCSNDYLGIVHRQLVHFSSGLPHGSTGSRLISGNHPVTDETEQYLARFHDAEAALLFNSGYDANLGLLSAVPQRGDTILYDQLSHASIRDGIRLSLARSFSFLHNDVADLEKKVRLATGNVFVVTESIFSMDGDTAPLPQMTALCERYGAHLIVDEAHATGVIGQRGEGCVQKENLQRRIFARVHTFGKAVGCHGAVILGSETLRNYLINFSRPFIYTTALPPSAARMICEAYECLANMHAERKHLTNLIRHFRTKAATLSICNSETPIQGIIIPGNDRVKEAAGKLAEQGLDLRPILSPTVPKGTERLRVVLHAFNTEEEVDKLLALIP